MSDQNLRFKSRSAIARSLFVTLHPSESDWFDVAWPLLCKALSGRGGPIGIGALPIPPPSESSQKELVANTTDIFELLMTQHACRLEEILESLEERFASRNQVGPTVDQALDTLRNWSRANTQMISFTEAGTAGSISLQEVSSNKQAGPDGWGPIDLLIINHEVFARLGDGLEPVPALSDIHASILAVFLWRGPLAMEADSLYFSVVPPEKQDLERGHSLSQFSTYLSRPIKTVYDALHKLEGFDFPSKKPERKPYLANITCSFQVVLSPARHLQLLG